MTLSYLEKVLIRFVWTEFSLEIKRALRGYSLNFWSDFKGIADPLLGDFVVYFEQSPVYLNCKWELILDSDLL